MDNFCIVRGNLFDNPSVKTLEHPERHSIHCLVDIEECTTSLYAILAPPNATNPLYSISYQLGVEGTKLAMESATQARVSGQRSGFSMNVSGIDDGTSELKCVEILSVTSSTATGRESTTGSGSGNGATESSTGARNNASTSGSLQLLISSSVVFTFISFCI